jgi:integrase/recombinase XerD
MKERKYKKDRKAHQEVIDGFAEWLKTKDYSKDMVHANSNYIASFLAWIKEEQIPEAETTYNELLIYIDHLTGEGDSKGLINHKLLAIRKYYNYLLYHGKAQKNPAAGLFIKNKRHTIPANLLSTEELTALYDNYQVTCLRDQRNKVMTGLLVYQAVTREELEKLEVNHIKLHTGNIEIPGGKHSRGRTLKLDPIQILDLQEYITITRQEILTSQGRYGTGRKPDSINREKTQSQLFISMHGTSNIKNSFLHLTYALRRLNPKIIDARQIRQSVITIWLKTKDLRTTQYMAGHRYVSSTERYQVNHLEDLQHQLDKLHPLNHP